MRHIAICTMPKHIHLTALCFSDRNYKPLLCSSSVTLCKHQCQRLYITFTLSQVSVPENVRRGTMIAWMQALDADSGSFGTDGVRYTDLAGDIAEL